MQRLGHRAQDEKGNPIHSSCAACAQTQVGLQRGAGGKELSTGSI